MSKIMILRRALVAAALTLAALPEVANAAESAGRTLSGSAPIEGIGVIAIDAGRASVSVQVQDTDAVTWRVTLRPVQDPTDTIGRAIRDWFFRPRYATADELIAAVRARAVTRGDVLDLSLEPPTSGRRERIHEEWTVVVPSRMAARVVVAEGSAEIAGVSGGVGLNMGVGTARVDAPAGDVEIDVGVGDIFIRYGTASLRSVFLSTGVGNADYSVSGLRGDHQAPAGAGDRISISGRGRNQIRATSDVGDIHLNVN